ncbi:phage integrase [Xenorhabdus innexi]|uniref:Integrase n=1 Tax=Xenorhabdus innexi TaxID=290109 RepID=A0A1N6MRR5_9GAMM|nr:tyrosine-type recombinase/integrase [Xenorhabdus innexi]PHM38555.1 integrase/recombinase XerC [Xenorhabdus innexi]SIP71553.1 Integrase [Xenorhabdus innexi]
MPIKKLDDGRYMVDIRPVGRTGNRIRRKFDKKAEAVAFERYTLAHAPKPGKSSNRQSLSDLLKLWWLYHGQTAENGAIENRQLAKTIKLLNDPSINRLNKHVLLEHRSNRLSDGIKASTINRDMYRLSGMITTLQKLEVFSGDNPLSGLPPLKEQQPEMTFLTKEEISNLLSVLSGDERKIALLCLSTGARWGEAETLKSTQVKNGRVTFLKTKNGKQRTIPISKKLEKEIKQKSGELFDVDYASFRVKLRSIKPDLPDGQATHVLRHTFASHFVMKGGNIVALQQILGHANIQQTMAYAHLAPDYLQLAITLNPLSEGIEI